MVWIFGHFDKGAKETGTLGNGCKAIVSRAVACSKAAMTLSVNVPIQTVLKPLEHSAQPQALNNRVSAQSESNVSVDKISSHPYIKPGSDYFMAPAEDSFLTEDTQLPHSWDHLQGRKFDSRENAEKGLQEIGKFPGQYAIFESKEGPKVLYIDKTGEFVEDSNANPASLIEERLKSKQSDRYYSLHLYKTFNKTTGEIESEMRSKTTGAFLNYSS